MNRKGRWAVGIGLVLIVAVAMPQKAVSQYMGKSAGIGALLGLALGSGNVIEDAAAGAALGAAGGGIANMATDGKRNKKQREADRIRAEEAARQAERENYMAYRERELAEQEKRWTEMELSKRERELMEREYRLAEQERLRQQAARQVTDAVAERDKAIQAIVDAIGPDVWEGYKALRGCQYDRAYALANVGAVSPEFYHQVGALWLEAMVAVDSRDKARADAIFTKIIQKDPEIDTAQQASLAADQAVLDMRAERREIGMPSCN
jgi:TolA-binding protein